MGAAKPLGDTYKSRSPWTFGKAGIVSFKGNKIIVRSNPVLTTGLDQFRNNHRLLQ